MIIGEIMVVDLIIIFLVILGAFVGAKRGFLKELVMALGFIVCVILSFLLKNPIAAILYDNLPFFSFGGILKGITALNILVYEVVAFFLTFTVLSLALKLVKMLSTSLENFFEETKILGLPSKILGGIVGAIEWLVICFAVLFILTLPVFKTNYIYNSKIYDGMLSLAPYFSKQIDTTTAVFKEFEDLKEQYKNSDDANQFNLDSLDLLLKYKIIDVEAADKLYKKGKFKSIINIESVLDKYRENNVENNENVQ